MWNYTDKVMDHFLNPRNVGEVENPDGQATVGNISCGDALKLSFKLGKDGKIEDVKFKTFGCGSAIASSSILTEMVKGKSLEEASKITNKDIVEALGGLPQAKVHCSVMGMEALQSAIANFKGEEYIHNDDDHDGKIVCHCFGVTDVKIKKLAKDNDIRDVEGITNYCKAGGACGRCKGEIKQILNSVWNTNEAVEKKDETAEPLTFAQKVLKIQSVIDSDIRPMLQKDGGNIEFIDLRGNSVVVKLKGRCSMCPSASVTLRNLVERKIQEMVAADLKVEENR